MIRIKYLFMTIFAALVLTGCSKDDDALGSLGEMSVSNTYVSIPVTGGEAKITFKANQSWKMKDIIKNTETGKTQYLDGYDKNTGDPIYKDLWCSISQLSGEAGEGEITFTAPASDGGHEKEIIIEVGETRQHLKVRQGEFTPEEVTCNFVNTQGLDGKNYRVKGVVTAIAQNVYGNMYISDGTGEVYIYGTLDKDGAEKNFASLGIEVGDEVTVEGPRVTYGSTVELSNVTVVKIVKSLIKIAGDSEISGISKDGGEFSVKVAYKGSGAFFSIPDDSKDFVVYKDSKFIAGVPTKLEKNPADTCVFTFNVLPNKGSKSRTGSIKFASSKGGNTSEVTYTFEQASAIVKGTISAFNADENGAEYTLTGVVKSINNSLYGNIYIVDGTGEAYIYGMLTPDGESKKFETLGVKEGDVVTVKGVRANYKGSPQMTNATYVSHITVPGGVTAASVAEFLAAPVNDETYYLLSGSVQNITNTKYGNFNIADVTGSVYVYGLLDGWAGASKNFASLGIVEENTISILGVRAEYNGTPQVGKGAYVSTLYAE